MRTKTVKRYWCDFCNKAGLSASHMIKHEKHCTMNPERECRCCKLVADSRDMNFEATPVKNLSALLIPIKTKSERLQPLYNQDRHETAWKLEKEISTEIAAVVPTIREAVAGCPMCFFAAIRQSGLSPYQVDGFDLKAEMAEILQGIRDDEENQRDMLSSYYAGI